MAASRLLLLSASLLGAWLDGGKPPLAVIRFTVGRTPARQG
jgi:hypothetical protein